MALGALGVNFWVWWLFLVNFPHRSTSCDKNIGWVAQNQEPRLENQEFRTSKGIQSESDDLSRNLTHLRRALFANG